MEHMNAYNILFGQPDILMIPEISWSNYEYNTGMDL